MSKSPVRRLLLVLALLVCATFSGCAWGNTYFQMDSNSRSPFFGFDLLSR
ncbi:MAG: hypothetical protein R3C18_07670 [Planctomycetaceae bacterium]